MNLYFFACLLRIDNILSISFINIFPYKVPYKKQDKTIQKMEIITDKDVAPYNDKNLFDKSIVIRVDIDYERHIVKDISYHKKGLKDIIFS